MKTIKEKTIDGYIADFPKDIQVKLKKLRQTIKKAAPRAVESISYNMPAFKFNGKPLAYFAAWNTHVGLYATPSSNIKFKKELAKYATAKGSIRFSFNKSIPFELVKKIISFRTQEIATKAKKESK